MLKIALIGYGQMGKMIEQLAPANDCVVVRKFDKLEENIEGVLDSEEISEDTLNEVDVCIDFSIADGVFQNIERCAKAGKNIVVGTTGWFDSLTTAEQVVRTHNTGLIYASNFSIGMNLFYLMLDTFAPLISQSNCYDVFGYEMHHNKKADSPSGTAKQLVEILQRHFPQKHTAQFDRIERKISQNELHFASIRAGSIPGTHTIGFDSIFDTIELKHTARTREGFAIGAIKAAHWIFQKKGMYEFTDVFTEIMK